MNLNRAIDRQLTKVMVEDHVTLLNGESPLPLRTDSAISAAVPHIRLERRRRSFQGRRKRLHFMHGASPVTVLARMRPLPALSPDRDLLVARAVDRYDRPVPVSVLDPRSHKLHLLIELESAILPPGSHPFSAPKAAEILTKNIFADPIRALLQNDSEEPWVGSKVPEIVRELLTTGRDVRKSALKSELSFLEAQFARLDVLPQAVRHHLDLLRRAAGPSTTQPSPPKEIRPRDVELEIQRILNLVKSRAISALEFTSEGVTGLANPRVLSRSWSQRPLMFRFQPTRFHGIPHLQVWDVQQESRKRTPCLGEAISAYQEKEASADLFGVLDLTLNFFETNLVGAVPPDGRRRRRPLRELLLSFL